MDMPPDPDRADVPLGDEVHTLPGDLSGDDLDAWLADQRWRTALDGWVVEAARHGRTHRPGAGAPGSAA